MHKFTFEALAPLIEELDHHFSNMAYAPEFYNSEKIIFKTLEIMKPYKALVQERKNQIESLQDGSRAWSAG
jgi:hypothetical protein